MPRVHCRSAIALTVFATGALAQAGPNITTTSLPAAAVGEAYNQTLAATGGKQPYVWNTTSGSLPAGLHLAASGDISGTPSSAGNSTFTVQVKDASNLTGTQQLTLTVASALAVTTASLPGGSPGAAYSQQLAGSGGSGGNAWSLAAGSLPQGLSLSAAGLISGTPTAPGIANFTVQVKDSGGGSASKQLSINIDPPALTITTSSLPGGTVGASYSQPLAATGGSGGYTWSVSAGSLPTGLTLSSGTIAGTPTAAGNSTFTVQVKDSSGATATKQLTITVNPAALTITSASLPNGTVGAAYSQALAASGGTGSNTWSIASGSLPAGLALSSGTIAGTPTAAGNSTFTVQVQDSSGATATKQLSITVNPAALTITTASLPNGTVGAAYSQALSASGGTGSNTWSVASGSLPAGLALSSGTIAGTPTAAGNSTFTVQVKDSSATTATKQLGITVNPAALTISTASLPNGTVGAAYSQALAASGGTGSYVWTVSAGSLAPGLTLNSGAIAGTPTSPGAFTFTIQVQDGSGASATKQLSITVIAVITITSSATLPTGSLGAPYTATLAATGGVVPYTWSLVTGQLPPGLTLNSSGSISGTPTSSGGYAFGVQVSDSSGAKAIGQAGITIRAALTISTPATLASGAVGAAYTQGLTATGGAAPYSWAITSGNLPNGVTLGASTGVISGTPTQTGSFQIGVQVVDSSSATATATFSIAIANGLVISTAPVLPSATVGVAYQLPLGAAGGTAPYQWSITTGTLPAGLTFNAAGQISGTPTAAGTFTFTAQAADSASHQVSKAFTLSVAGALTITSAPSLPAAATGLAYRQALAAVGGTAPYVWSVSAGSLPTGLALDPSVGILSGTPTSAGSSTFTVTVTDSNSVATQQAFTLTVGQGLTITSPSSLPDGTAGAAYSYTLNAGGGQSPYSWTVTQGALPAGISLAASGTISGTPTAGGTFSFTVQTTDASGLSTTHAETLAVDLPALSGLQIAGLPATIASAQQPLLDLALSQAFPSALTGVLNLSFAPASNMPDDPAVQFSTGGRSATFTIPAGATHATFAAPQFALQTGSVAGAITVSIASLQSGDASVTLPGNVTSSVQIPPAVPSIRSVTMTPTSGGLQVQLVGLSNTRELTQAMVTFQPSAGSSLETGSLVVPLGSVSTAWFPTPGSTPYGGQFTLTLPFNVNGASNVVGSVSVVLSNTVGDSSPLGSQ